MGATTRTLLVLCLWIPSVAEAQRQADLDAVNRLVDQYGALEDAMDMTAQAQLMSPDRIQIGQAGRRTDQAVNMRIQQAGIDEMKKALPGVKFFTEDRDRLIKFYGNDAVAVVSFFRYRTRILPAGTPADLVMAYPPVPPTAFTLVLEKRQGEWKIVHTHSTILATPTGT